jgi:ketosteroid isomerase-like protein
MNKSIIILLLVLTACQGNVDMQKIEQWKAEITNTEHQFAAVAEEKGIAAAFYEYADSNAAIKREGKVIRGREAIKKYYDSQNLANVRLQWTPSFVDVSTSGDLGYTYGDFIYSEKDSTGKVNETKGIFHTVWKKQKDGGWKYVWD